MSYVFGPNTTLLFRLKIWVRDLIRHFLALTSYIKPAKLRPTPISEKERKEWESLEEIE